MRHGNDSASAALLEPSAKVLLTANYSPKELIFDDPGQPAFDGIRPVPEIRYRQANARLTVGSQLTSVSGEREERSSEKPDDDDYYHPEFLSATVGALDGSHHLWHGHELIPFILEPANESVRGLDRVKALTTAIVHQDHVAAANTR